MDNLHQLVRVVARSFYDDKYVVIFDTIVRETMIPDDVLIDRMQIVIRDLNRIFAHLIKDRLIKCETKQQPRADGKIITRNFFYIDYKQFVDIVKYRIYKMRQSVEEMIKREMESKGYICPQCKTVFSSLDVSRLLNARTGGFDCDICPESELQAYDSLNSVIGGLAAGAAGAGPHELHSRLMEQTRLIVELLKRADDITIPAFNPALWLEKNASKYSLLDDTDRDNQDNNGPQLAIAGANSSMAQVTTLSVDFVDDSEVQAADSSVSTPLPEWHMYSTVTGDAIRQHHNIDPSAQFNRNKNKLESQEESLDKKASDRDDILNYYTQMAGEELNIEDDMEEEPTTSKQPKLENTETVNVSVVLVAGCPIALDQITEDDKDKMTEEEYTRYYEIYMSQLQ